MPEPLRRVGSNIQGSTILAILPEALTRKTAHDVLPLVNLALPAFVSPGGRAEPDEGRK